ncbi:SNF2-domain helicase [Pseudomonas phage Psa21]|uniref:SNF2-domain helicase n=1 Tax=Pseudomonas phage Psa21 TaxID=2530023 RepID=A0A481W6F9_9CAUD|nr:SNF2-domain helicase [Pseudomonas phage Psa21]QBJ02797.1 SNF2-domain helicase [Pseudomonas phage Psa21]
MQSYFRRVMGVVVAKEQGNEIILSGVNGSHLVRDISKHWKTSRIASNIFNHASSTELRFYKFFAPDFMYILDSVMNYRSRYISVKQAAAIRAAMIESTWIGQAYAKPDPNKPGRLDFKQLEKFKFTPKQEQMDYFKSYNHRLDQWNLTGDLLHAEPGTGKTAMTTMIGEMLHADRMIFFVEKRAVNTVWVPSMESNDYSDTVSLEEMYKEGPSVWASDMGRPYNNEKVIVVHYQWLANFLDIIHSGVFKGLKIFTALDECHNMNDPKSLQTQLYIACVKALGSKDNILASGTPVKALGTELITLMAVSDPLFTPEVEARFKLIFGKEGGKGLDIIRHRMGFMSFFIAKTEESTGLKPPIMKPYKIQIPNGKDFTLAAIKVVMEQFIRERVKFYKDRKPQDDKYWAQCLAIHESKLKTKEQIAAYNEYRRVLKIVIANPDPRFTGEEIKATNRYEKLVFGPSLPQSMIHEFRDVKSAIKYVMLKIQGETLGRILGGKRIECHVAMVPYVDWVGIVESTQKKTIMFTSFVEALEASEVHVRKLGMSPIAVYGKTSNELASIVTRFDKDPKLNPLLATYASLATAVRLTMADTMLILNSPFRSYILEQAIARIYRIGQDSQTIVFTATLDTGEEPNISTRSADILAWSQSMVEEITGVKSPFEQKEAFESFIKEQPEELDEHRLMHGTLQKAFEQFDIVIDSKQFEIPKTVNRIPGWMR